jgi:hypothetical protein
VLLLGLLDLEIEGNIILRNSGKNVWVMSQNNWFFSNTALIDSKLANTQHVVAFVLKLSVCGD